MKKIYPIILAAAVAVIALFTSSCGSRSQQPVYDGKPVSEWISDLSYQKPKALRVQAQQSLRQIGTNAIPFLLEEMDDLGIMWRGGVTNFYNTPGAEERYANLHLAFQVLGPIAKPAVPLLISALNSDSGSNYTGEVASFALTQIDPQIAAVALNQALTSNVALTRLVVALNLRYIGTNADIAVPNLILCLKERSPDKDPSLSIRMPAFGDLIQLVQDRPEQIVPVLINELKDDDFYIRCMAARAFGNLGKQAPQAVIPILIEMSTNDPDKNVRAGATDALKKIQASTP
jgi:hypothetical protein